MKHPLPLLAESRPCDFAARLNRRRLRRLGKAASRRGHSGRRLLVLLAAVAVPAFAAPDGWRGFAIGDAGNAAFAMEPMPFERSGDSFPGSAFYYLAQSEGPAAGLFAATQDAALADLARGPIARAMQFGHSGLDRSRAVECLTAAIYYEAASEPDQGQRAVAQVVLNRVAHPAYPGTVCGVVYQGSERSTGCQFSFTCDGALARRPASFFWDRARHVAQAALAGSVEPSVGLSTHYHTLQVNPYWAPSLHFVTTIGAHRFYSFRGKAGASGTFRFAYGGSEPAAAPHARSLSVAASADPALDPLALQAAYDAGYRQAAGTQSPPAPGTAANDRTMSAPRYAPDVEQRGGDRQFTADSLPGSTVRPEYRNTGQWIARPGN